MNRDDIIRMAREAGIKDPAPARQGFKMYANPQRLERFAALVAAHEEKECVEMCAVLRKMAIEEEREECAKIAETPFSGEQDDYTMQAKDRVAAAIRARGEI